MKKKLLFFVAASLMVPKLVGATSDHLVISQIQTTGGAGHTANDFVEIYNPTSHEIDLNGTRLVKRTQNGTTDTLLKSWTASTVVPAGGYYLWANSGFADIAAVPDITTSGTISDDNGIALRSGPNDTGTIVDSVGWGNAANVFVEGSVFATNPPANQSITRTSGTDTDNNATDFIIQPAVPHNLSMSATTPAPTPPPDPTPMPSPTPSPTPTPVLPPDPAPTPSPSPQGGGGGGILSYSQSMVISEFLPNPDGSDTGEEWIELFNNSDSPVDLSGWILDDESKTGAIGSSAYKFSAGSVVAGKQYFVVDLPEGSFALDNTGGDTLRLIWPDNTVATQIVYTGNAAEDTTYALKDDGSYAWTEATKGAANHFEQSGQQNLEPLTTVQNYQGFKIKLNELFPNPPGSDSGQEWVEVLNLGTDPVTMHGWVLDDGGMNDQIGSSAYTIQSPTVQPGGVAIIQIPAGKFAMNNSGTETIRLFSPDKILADFASYSGAKEGLSYAKIGEDWAWITPTPNLVNLNPEKKDSVVINEVFPYPSHEEEFIELLNISDNSVNLSGWKLKDQNGSYALPSQILDPGMFLVVYRSESNTALANSAKENLELINDSGLVVSALQYEDAPKNESLARTDLGDYDWTMFVTSGIANKFSDSGQVAGATLVRTGNPDGNLDPTFFYFAAFTIIWYIAKRIANPEKETYEQTGTN